MIDVLGMFFSLLIAHIVTLHICEMNSIADGGKVAGTLQSH